MHRGTGAVYCENLSKHINALCRQNEELLNLTACGTCSYHFASTPSSGQDELWVWRIFRAACPKAGAQLQCPYVRVSSRRLIKMQRWPEREPDYSTHCRAEVREAWSCISMPQWAKRPRTYLVSLSSGLSVSKGGRSLKTLKCRDRGCQIRALTVQLTNCFPEGLRV